MKWFRRAGSPKPSGDEERLCLEAEDAQRWVCAHWGAPFERPSADSLVAISPLVLQGHMPVAGVRYRMTGKISGWIIYASDHHEEVDDLTYVGSTNGMLQGPCRRGHARGCREWTALLHVRLRFRCVPSDRSPAHTFWLGRRHSTGDHPAHQPTEDTSVISPQPP